MKILHVLSQTELTGAEVYAKNLVEYQLKEGHEVYLISERLHVKLPVSWTSLPLSRKNRWERLKNILSLRNFLIKNKIEIIHCHSRGAVRHAYWSRLFLPIAMTTTLHGRQHSSLSKKIMNIYGELLIAVCKNVKKTTAKNFFISPDQIQIIPNPVQTAEYPSSSKEPILALIGRSTGPKGRRFEALAKSCFGHWLQELPNLKIDIIVPSLEAFSPGFLAFIEHLNKQHSQRISLKGHIPQLAEHMRRYSLVVASGRVAIEALQQRIPVIALGEYHCHGLVDEHNFQLCLDSNFGDMGDDELEIPLDTNSISKEVFNFFRSPDQKHNRESLQNRAKAYYSPSRVNEEIINLYYRAIFKRKFPRWIPILMYHKIPSQDLKSQHRIFVVKEIFEKHLRFFTKHQFTTITLQQLCNYIFQKIPLSSFPKKPIILTFDDGYKDNLTNAEPLLKKYGMKANIFLLANHEILENTWDTKNGDEKSEILSFDDKLKLDKEVWEIGSHGFDHLSLPSANPDQTLKEIFNSRLKLESDFHCEINSFAYPYGHRNEELETVVKNSNYAMAVNTDQGAFHVAENLYSIFRVNIFPEDGSLALWKKTSSWYRRYFYWKRKK